MSDLLDQLNSVAGSFSQADIYIIAGGLSAGFLGLINNVKELKKHQNVILSWIIPFLGAGLEATFNNSDHTLVKGTLVYFLSQVCYYSVKAVSSNKTSAEEVAEVPAPANF